KAVGYKKPQPPNCYAELLRFIPQDIDRRLQKRADAYDCECYRQQMLWKRRQEWTAANPGAFWNREITFFFLPAGLEDPVTGAESGGFEAIVTLAMGAGACKTSGCGATTLPIPFGSRWDVHRNALMYSTPAVATAPPPKRPFGQPQCVDRAF